MKSPRPIRTQTEESSVVFSLQELVQLERQRVEEEARERVDEQVRAERAREAIAEAARIERAMRAAAEERVRNAAELERGRHAELQRRMDDAQIEAAKLAELETRSLERRTGLERERHAAEQRHAREMAELRAVAGRTNSGLAARILVSLAGLAILAIGTVVVLALRHQREAIVADTPALAEQRDADRRAADAREAKQQAEIDALRAKLKATLEEKPVVPALSASATNAVKSTSKKVPNVVDHHKSSEGCTVEISGVPMCGKPQ